MSVPSPQQTWTSINSAYTSDVTLINNTFKDITDAYGSIHRYYHNMQHIEQLLFLYHQYADHIKHRDNLLFALFFHDIIYDVPGPDNEEQSAAAAVTYLHKINYPTPNISVVQDFIIATKTHINTQYDTDLDYLLDFDLQVLGAAPEQYVQYSRQIRQEYSIYPDAIYNPGRKKVLEHFLEMPAIFRTNIFSELYETPARRNIQAEINTL